MDAMFHNAVSFDQDLYTRCVDQITSEPDNFKTDTPSSFSTNSKKQPQRGGCIE